MPLLAALLDPVTTLAAAPNPAPIPPPGLAQFADNFLGWLKWVGLAAGVAGLMFCGIMMMIGRRNRSQLAAEGASGIPWVVGGLSVVSLAAGITGAVLTG